MATNDAAPSLPKTEINADLAAMLLENPKGASALRDLFGGQLIALNDNYSKSARAMAMSATVSGHPAYYLGATKATEAMLAAINTITEGQRS